MNSEQQERRRAFVSDVEQITPEGVEVAISDDFDPRWPKTWGADMQHIFSEAEAIQTEGGEANVTAYMIYMTSISDIPEVAERLSEIGLFVNCSRTSIDIHRSISLSRVTDSRDEWISTGEPVLLVVAFDQHGEITDYIFHRHG